MTELVDPIKQIDEGLSDPKGRMQAAQIIQKKIENDTTGNMNTNTQWAPFVASLLSRDYQGALNAWNGGLTRQVDAYGPDNTRYIKEYNARGATGRLFTINGEQLTPEQVAEIDKRGGLISKEDLTATNTGSFMSERSAVQDAAAALRKPALDAFQNAQRIALASAGIANLHKEMADLASKATWMDAVAKLNREERSKLFQIVSQQNQASQGSQTESGQTASQSASQAKTAGKTQGAQLGIDLGGRAGIAPPAGGPGAGGGVGNVGIAPSIGGQVSGGASTSATNQATGATGVRASAQATAGTSVQQQTTFQSAVNGILQGAIQDAQGFSDLQRYVGLYDQIRKAEEKRGVSDLAPGAQALPEIDPALSGRQNAALASYQGIQNEALLSAWNHYMAKEINAKRGAATNMHAAANDFLASPVARGIMNRFDQIKKTVKTGQAYVPEKGDIVTDNQNRPRIWSGSKWEPLDVK